jgi:hypothetical protein
VDGLAKELAILQKRFLQKVNLFCMVDLGKIFQNFSICCTPTCNFLEIDGISRPRHKKQRGRDSFDTEYFTNFISSTLFRCRDSGSFGNFAFCGGDTQCTFPAKGQAGDF